MSEHDEQQAVCDYLNRVHPGVLYHSNPNGAFLAGNAGQRAAQMNKLKAEGFLPGVSDIFIAEPRGRYHGFYLEMKDAPPKGGKPSENQLWFIDQAEKRGYFTAVARGFEEAKYLIICYLVGSEDR